MSDIILISKVGIYETIKCAICKNPNQTERGCDGACQYDKELHAKIVEAVTGIAEQRPHGEWLWKENERYTYCRDCFYKMGSPTGTVVNHNHRCRKCGRSITGKYNCCMDCAKVLFADNLRWQKRKVMGYDYRR